MNRHILLTLLLLTSFLSCSSLGDGVYKDFDQFSNKDTVTCVLRLQQEQGFETFKIVFVYNDIDSSDTFSAYLYTETAIWYYFHRIGYKIDDDEPVYREEIKFKRNTLLNQKANEIVYFIISREEIESMALAEQVYFRFEGEKFIVSSQMNRRNFTILGKFLDEVQKIEKE